MVVVKGSTFVKKLWCCVSGEYIKISLDLFACLIMKIGHHKEFLS